MEDLQYIRDLFRDRMLPLPNGGQFTLSQDNGVMDAMQHVYIRIMYTVCVLSIQRMTENQNQVQLHHVQATAVSILEEQPPALAMRPPVCDDAHAAVFPNCVYMDPDRFRTLIGQVCAHARAPAPTFSIRALYSSQYVTERLFDRFLVLIAKQVISHCNRRVMRLRDVLQAFNILREFRPLLVIPDELDFTRLPLLPPPVPRIRRAPGRRRSRASALARVRRSERDLRNELEQERGGNQERIRQLERQLQECLSELRNSEPRQGGSQNGRDDEEPRQDDDEPLGGGYDDEPLRGGDDNEPLGGGDDNEPLGRGEGDNPPEDPGDDNDNDPPAPVVPAIRGRSRRGRRASSTGLRRSTRAPRNVFSFSLKDFESTVDLRTIARPSLRPVNINGGANNVFRAFVASYNSQIRPQSHITIEECRQSCNRRSGPRYQLNCLARLFHVHIFVDYVDKGRYITYGDDGDPNVFLRCIDHYDAYLLLDESPPTNVLRRRRRTSGTSASSSPSGSDITRDFAARIRALPNVPNRPLVRRDHIAFFGRERMGRREPRRNLREVNDFEIQDPRYYEQHRASVPPTNSWLYMPIILGALGFPLPSAFSSHEVIRAAIRRYQQVFETNGFHSGSVLDNDVPHMPGDIQNNFINMDLDLAHVLMDYVVTLRIQPQQSSARQNGPTPNTIGDASQDIQRVGSICQDNYYDRARCDILQRVFLYHDDVDDARRFSNSGGGFRVKCAGYQSGSPEYFETFELSHVEKMGIDVPENDMTEREWIGQTHIAAFMQVLTNQDIEARRAGIAYIHGHHVQTMLNPSSREQWYTQHNIAGGPGSPERQLNTSIYWMRRFLGYYAQDISSIEHVYFPANVGNNHFVTLHIDIPRKQVLYYDSLDFEHYVSMAQGQLDIILPAISAIYYPSGPYRWPFRNRSVRIQRDTGEIVNCGSYVALTVELLRLENGDATLLPHFERRGWYNRYRMAAAIWRIRDGARSSERQSRDT